jgi:hypothetical protein
MIYKWYRKWLRSRDIKVSWPQLTMLWGIERGKKEFYLEKVSDPVWRMDLTPQEIKEIVDNLDAEYKK